MPLFLFLFSILLIFAFQKEIRKYLFPFIISSSLFFFLMFNFNSKIHDNFINFYNQIDKARMIILDNNFSNNRSPQYLKEFATFYDTWLMNKYVGGGIKNFRCYCHHRPNVNKDAKFICNMHPHNYYLEILTETGIIGFLIILIIFTKAIYFTFIKKYFLKSHLNDNILIIPFIFLFFVEIFPIKSSGSFFTTGNTTYLFLILGVLIGLVRNNYKIEKFNFNL